jgi:hypothetical protein
MAVTPVPVQPFRLDANKGGLLTSRNKTVALEPLPARPAKDGRAWQKSPWLLFFDLESQPGFLLQRFSCDQAGS